VVSIALDPFYNCILGFMLAVWLVSTQTYRLEPLLKRLKKRRYVAVAALWVVFLAYAAFYVTDFSYSADTHDIDDAVEAGAISVSTGVNPYEQNVIPRFASRYSADVQWTYGHYNYLPFDLLVYSACEEALGFLGVPVWFVVMNFIFSGAAFFLLYRMMHVRWFSLVPVAGLAMLFYSFDNGSLTLLLVVASVYTLERSKSHPEGFSLILMGLAALTKIYAVLPLAVLFLFVVQKSVANRNWKLLSETTAATAVAAGFAFAVMLPFGVANVLNSAVLFHADPVERAGTSMGGTLLGELSIGDGSFFWVSLALVVVALFAGLGLRNLNDRVLLLMSVFLMVAVKSSYAPLLVAGVFLGLRMRDRAMERRIAQNQPEAVDQGVPDNPPPSSS